ncbi:MAG: type IV pilus modification protein PilV [Gammaproteobacteria bacterium]|nr:type IV pilus modification protein PilV [Gammaproteobacteria bacterium]
MKYLSSRQIVLNHLGFTFIEILVSIVIIAIGLLGLTKLQITSLRYNQNAYQRSIATQLAYDLSNRMRANKQGVELGFYNLPTAQQHTACLTSAGCTPAEMARHDVYEWLSDSSPTSVVNQLPNASATVCMDSTPVDGDPEDPVCDGLGSQYAIKIWWSDDDGATTFRFVTSVQI